MGKLYIYHTLYEPNTAPTNRVLSFLKALSTLGVETEMVYVLPDKEYSRYPDLLPNVRFTYLWEKQRIQNRYLNQLLYSFNTWRFSKRLRHGDVVIVMDMSRAIFTFLKMKGVKIYHEKTEHPYAYHVRTINIEKYIKACCKLDGLFVISTSLRDYFIQRGLPEKSIQIINMTVDPSRFEGVTKDETKENYIAYCGTASHSKDGVDELIKAFSIFNKKYPDYKLYIIGKVPTRNEEKENIKLIESLGLSDSVILKGIIDYKDMPQVLTDASILALDRPDSLQAKNGFPTKLGEYLLSGNPIVVTNVGDIPLFLENEKNAMIARERDPEDFASKLSWLVEHPEKAKKIGEEGKRVAIESFNSITEVRKILKFIKR